MFDFDAALERLVEEEAEAARAEKRRKDRIREIKGMLVTDARDYRVKYAKNFDVQLSGDDVELVTLSGSALKITIKSDDSFDVTDKSDDVNAKHTVDLHSVDAKMVAEAVVKWTRNL